MRLLYVFASLCAVVSLIYWRWKKRVEAKHGFSGDWWADERLKVLRRAAEFEGVSHSGKFKR